MTMPKSSTLYVNVSLKHMVQYVGRNILGAFTDSLIL